MINWLHVTLNAFWIVGCALILAAFSYTHWLANVRGVRTRQLLGKPAHQLPFSAGLTLISLGVFFLSSGWLERAVWAAFTLLFIWQSFSIWHSTRHPSSEQADKG